MIAPLAITRSGLRVDLVAPWSATICSSDIGEHLAKLARWIGATSAPFSIAQHSLIVAGEMHRLADAHAALYGLMHDAHEAYIGDITEPMAAALEHFHPGAEQALRIIRARLDRAIHERFDLDWPVPADYAGLLAMVHERVRLAEMRDLMAGCQDHLAAAETENRLPLGRRIVPYNSWTKADAEWRTMLARYAALAGLRLNLG